MGVNLRSIITLKAVRLEDLSGRIIAIDTYNALYQFLAIIRQPDGTPLKDSTGKVTSHLSGLLYRTSKLIEFGIKPIYVFDGVPPVLKEIEIKRRMKAKEEATVKYERAVAKGDMTKARVYAQATSRLKDYMSDDSKRLLALMGLPWVQAPGEGEAQAAYMARRGDAEFCASQDYDSLLFGAPKLVRNVTLSGRRKLPRKNLYINVVPEVVDFSNVLKECGVTHKQLVDVAILIGTDFNPDGVKGLGAKTALKLIKKHGTLERTLQHIKSPEFPHPPQKIRDVFLKPKVTHNYAVAWGKPDEEGIVDFLCREKDFSEERVRKVLDRIRESTEKQKGKTTLEKWFQ